MGKSASIVRILIAFMFVSGLLAPFTTWDVQAEDPPATEPTTGVLQVALNGADTGAPLPGACWDVTDANGVIKSDCDFDYDGLTSFELVPGGAWIQQVGGAEGYYADASGQQAVVAGEIRTVNFSNVAKPAPAALTVVEEPTATLEPTPEPTATLEPTVEPTATEVPPTEEPAATVTPTPEPQVELPVEPTPAPGEDADGDTVANSGDNCVDVANLDQTDTDGDGMGDACDDNDDNDSHLDVSDNCPLVSNKGQLDRDNDGIGNACDDKDDSQPARALLRSRPLTRRTTGTSRLN